MSGGDKTRRTRKSRYPDYDALLPLIERLIQRQTLVNGGSPVSQADAKQIASDFDAAWQAADASYRHDENLRATRKDEAFRSRMAQRKIENDAVFGRWDKLKRRLGSRADPTKAARASDGALSRDERKRKPGVQPPSWEHIIAVAVIAKFKELFEREVVFSRDSDGAASGDDLEFLAEIMLIARANRRPNARGARRPPSSWKTTPFKRLLANIIRDGRRNRSPKQRRAHNTRRKRNYNIPAKSKS